MRTWLLVTLDESERIYHGNLGYADEIRSVYRFDNFVPNCTRVSQGDIAIVRGKSEVHGSAVIQSLTAKPGTKSRQRCPTCNSTSLKQRKTLSPQYRCECGAEFDSPVTEETEAIIYEAGFGDSFSPLPADTDIRHFWQFALRLNKQHSIQELDTAQTQSFLSTLIADLPHPGEFPLAATTGKEGNFQIVSVNRYERDPRLRQACIDHYGSECFVCGFDFSVAFGPHFKGVIEVRHLNPLAKVHGVHEGDAVRDLRPLFPNCHTVAHRRDPPFTVDELKSMLNPPH
jgi:hypothetical protein